METVVEGGRNPVPPRWPSLIISNTHGSGDASAHRHRSVQIETALENSEMVCEWYVRHSIISCIRVRAAEASTFTPQFGNEDSAEDGGIDIPHEAVHSWAQISGFWIAPDLRQTQWLWTERYLLTHRVKNRTEVGSLKSLSTATIGTKKKHFSVNFTESGRISNYHTRDFAGKSYKGLWTAQKLKT